MFGPIEQLKTYALIGLGIALLLALGTAHYYHSEYKVIEVQYEGFKEQTRQLGEQAKKHAKEIEDRDKDAKEKSDDEHKKQDAIIKSGWAADRAERDRLRKQLGDSRSRPVPGVTIGAGVSCDKASADAISAAISEYVKDARRTLGDCRAAATDFRDKVAQQLEQAESNTAALMCGIGWATKSAPAVNLKPPRKWWQLGSP